MKKWLTALIMRILPIKNTILFESIPDFSDNTFWLFKYMAENTDFFKEYKCVWFLADIKEKKKELFGVPITCVNHSGNSVIERIKRFYYTYTAKLIIDCNFIIPKKRDGQIRIYLTHGMPIKIPDEYLRGLGEVDLLPVSGTLFADFFRTYVSEESIKVLGSPRNDVLIERRGFHSPDKYIVWMPTFRQHKDSDNINRIENRFPFGLPVIKTESDISAINGCLEESGVTLAIRPHPAQDMSVFKLEEKKNIVIANDEYLKSRNISLYEYLANSSALITDYSSVYYDYLLLQKPIALTLEDAKEYSKQWPLFFKDIRNDLPAIHIDTIADFFEFIQSVAAGSDSRKNERHMFADRFGIHETEACKNIYRYISDKVSN